MASVTRNFATGWSLGLQPFSPSQKEEVDLDRHIALILARTGRFSTGWAVIMLLLWWPTDLLVFHRLPAALPAFATLRAALLAACLLVVVGLWRREAVSPRAQLLFFAPWPLACLAMSYSLGTLGGLDTPWFHFTYLCVALTIFFPVRPLRRAAYAILVAASLILGHLAADPAMVRSPFLPATLGFLVFIVVGSVAFGQLLFLLTRSHFFQAQALRRNADDLSEQVAGQTRELRQLAQHLGRALEAERARISRELHDELGQELTALRYELRFARQRFEQDPASIRANLANLEELLSRTTVTSRGIVTDLRPRILDDLGLCAAAEWLAERTQERTGQPCTLRLEGKEPAGLDGEVSIAAFRVLQESLTNAARHASARRIEVSLSFQAGAVELSICDDGVGIGAADGHSSGMGLLGMRERARALGGTLRVLPREGGGTRVHCVLPVSQGAAP